MSDIDELQDLMAKSDNTTLYQHTKDVISTTIKIYEKLPSSIQEIQNLLESALISAYFHDLGKAHEEFQKLLENKKNRWNRKRHELISGIVFLIFMQKGMIISKNFDLKDWFIPIWFSIILHHKGLYQPISLESYSNLNLEEIISIPFETYKRRFVIGYLKPFLENMDKIQNLISHLNKYLKKIEKDLSKELFHIKISHIDLSSLEKLSDLFIDKISNKEIKWSNVLKQGGQSPALNYEIRKRSSYLLGILKTADHLASGKIEPINQVILSNYSLEYEPFSFQKRVGKIDRSLLLRAPTGSGKTLAAIMWAQKNQKKNSRLFYVLPFQASLNAMYRRLYEFLHPNQKDNPNHSDIFVGICHARNLSFLDSFFTEKGLSDIDPFKLKRMVRETYYPVKVSTAHQLLRLILFGKGWEQLLLEINDCIVIFDEIHAYEPRLLGLILGLMQILRKFGSKILIMTATIPTFILKLINTEVFQNEDLQFIKLSEDIKEDYNILNNKRHKIKFYDSNIIEYFREHEKTIIQRFKNSQSQLFICNTVGTAQKLYQLFKNNPKIKNNSILLLHSRYNSRDREDIEKKVVDKSKKYLNNIKILIATQVVEVSLDINFYFGYFEIAPIDALIQRMGRINRSGGIIYDKSQINIVVMKNSINDSLIYPSKIVKNTFKALKELENRPIAEMELVKKVDEVYPKFNIEQLEEFKKGLNHPNISNYENQFEVGKQLEWLVELVQDSDNIIELIPKECINEFKDLWYEKEYIKARNLLLSLNINHFPIKLKEKLQIGTKWFYVLNDARYCYDKEYGLRKI